MHVMYKAIVCAGEFIGVNDVIAGFAFKVIAMLHTYGFFSVRVRIWVRVGVRVRIPQAIVRVTNQDFL